MTGDPPSPAAVPESFNPSDAACAAVREDGAVVARCSLWWSRTPLLDGRRAGLIGRYSSADAGAGQALIARACAELRARGCAIAVGPMDGSTWDSYRFVTGHDGTPRFFLEPENDDDWPLQFLRAGFHPIARYHSALQAELGLDDRRIATIEERMRAAAIRARCVDAGRLEEEIERMHALVIAGFRDSPFFTPIPVGEFVARHRRLLTCIQPELVLVAEQQGRPVALLFAVPDLAQAQRGETVDTAIVKTVVALPGRAYAGIAHVLAARAAVAARALGYRRAIHALMRDGIHSMNWSARCGATIRRYALFARPL